MVCSVLLFTFTVASANTLQSADQQSLLQHRHEKFTNHGDGAKHGSGVQSDVEHQRPNDNHIVDHNNQPHSGDQSDVEHQHPNVNHIGDHDNDPDLNLLDSKSQKWANMIFDVVGCPNHIPESFELTESFGFRRDSLEHCRTRCASWSNQKSNDFILGGSQSGSGLDCFCDRGAHLTLTNHKCSSSSLLECYRTRLAAGSNCLYKEKPFRKNMDHCGWTVKRDGDSKCRDLGLIGHSLASCVFDYCFAGDLVKYSEIGGLYDQSAAEDEFVTKSQNWRTLRNQFYEREWIIWLWKFRLEKKPGGSYVKLDPIRLSWLPFEVSSCRSDLLPSNFVTSGYKPSMIDSSVIEHCGEVCTEDGGKNAFFIDTRHSTPACMCGNLAPRPAGADSAAYVAGLFMDASSGDCSRLACYAGQVGAGDETCLYRKKSSEKTLQDCTAEDKQRGRTICESEDLSGAALHSCVFDYCFGDEPGSRFGSKKEAASWWRMMARYEHRVLKVSGGK